MSLSSTSTTTDPSIVGACDGHPYATAARRRRTRRRRLRELHPPTPSCSSTSSSPRDHYEKTTDGAGKAEEDEEEEDNYMAYCLMLLSRGRAPSTEATSVVVPSVATATAHCQAAEVETGAYRCKTCNKAFSSFQALGGHRTSHTKVRPPPAAAGLAGPAMAASSANNNFSATIAINISPPKPRVHTCSVCGAEFASGQALGGHMRRHRPVAGASSVVAEDAYPEAEEDKAVMLLDLNAPPPPQLDASGFAFTDDAPPPLQFSPLVDCHY